MSKLDDILWLRAEDLTDSEHVRTREDIKKLVLKLISKTTSNWGNGKDLCDPDELRKKVEEL